MFGVRLWLTKQYSKQCDEAKPICGNCKRIKFTCSFEQESEAIADIKHNPGIHRASANDEIQNGHEDDDFDHREPLEDHSEYLTEAKLMQIYLSLTCPTLYTDDKTSEEVFVHDVPRMAVSNDALRSALLSFTALHLAVTQPEDAPRHMLAHHRYFAAAVKHHAKDVSSMNGCSFDAATCTAIFIRMDAMAMLQLRRLCPYSPPLDWYDVSRSAMSVFHVLDRWEGDHADAAAMRLRRRMPFVFDEKAKFDPDNRRPFSHLLAPVGDDDLSILADSDRSAYENTVSYIGGIWLNMQQVHATSEMQRRLILLPYLVDPHLRDLLNDFQPRAIVVMAYYFALLSKFRHLWWIGDLGEREVHAAAAWVPLHWRPLLDGAFDIIST